ncbi:hypothetical protein DFP73DRAFT_26552 [Morchella snyderi]|nr:hypothetical protein DFP73DRAFT_26552 [Morchella snyderi]
MDYVVLVRRVWCGGWIIGWIIGWIVGLARGCRSACGWSWGELCLGVVCVCVQVGGRQRQQRANVSGPWDSNGAHELTNSLTTGNRRDHCAALLRGTCSCSGLTGEALDCAITQPENERLMG